MQILKVKLIYYLPDDLQDDIDVIVFVCGAW